MILGVPVVEVAWQAHFVTNMFIRPSKEELENFKPDFVVLNASKAKVENWKELGIVVIPAMFVIADKQTLGICRKSGLAGA